MTVAYDIGRWWLKVYEVRHLTEDYAYAEDQVPETYGGPKLDVEIVQRVILTDSAGYIREIRMDDLDDVRDVDDLDGVGATCTLLEGLDITIAATGPSTHVVTWKVKVNPALTQAEKTRAEFLYREMVTRNGGL